MAGVTQFAPSPASVEAESQTGLEVGGAPSLPSYPEIPSEAPFPLESLPLDAQKMIAEVARVSFAPEKLVAVQALGWMAAALGKGVASQAGATVTYPNLFILGISGTGTGKSESGRHLGRPFERFLEDEIKKWNQETKPKTESRLREINLCLKALDKGARISGSYGSDRSQVEQLMREQNELAAKKSPKLIVEDSTQEALVDALNSYDRSLLSYSTDAGKVISNLLGRYTATTAGDTLREDTVFLKGYSVEDLSVQRMGRDSVVREPCLTLLWMIQPGKTETLYGDGALCDGGFLPRVMPCLTAGGLPQITFEDKISMSVSTGWNNLLGRFLNLRSKGGSPGDPERVVFEITKEAYRHWLDWNNFNRAKTKNGELKDVSAYVSRWGEWAQRIAVTLQAALYLEDKSVAITLETMEAAIKIAGWFANEQLRIIHAARVIAADNEHAKQIERAKRLESLLEQSQREKTVADLGRRNGFEQDELSALCEAFPDRFEIRNKPTSTKPARVCVLK